MLQKGFTRFARLTCAWRYGRLLSAYLDNELDAHAADAIASHLRECNRCRAELEQLRFANRALVEFEIPPMRSPVSGGNLLRLPPLNSTFTLKKLYSQKIAVPLPLAAGVVIALITATWIATTRSQQTPVQSASSVAAPPNVITRIVEVPVERVVTRPVYFRRSGPGRTRGPRENGITITPPDSKKDIAQNEARPPEWSENSLKDFRPASSANLRVVKEHKK